MKPHHQPSGLQNGLELFIDPLWSPEQAMAIIELLDDLRDRIWAHYMRSLCSTDAVMNASRVTTSY